MSKQQSNKAVTMLQNELRVNATAIATATASVYGATGKQASLLNEYFNLVFGEARWMEANPQEKTPLSDEVRIQREIVVNACNEKGHANGRMVWKRIRDTAFELAFPKEAEAKKEAKKGGKPQGSEGNPEVEGTIELSEAMLEAARFLAGECDWDKVLANRALATVFAEAKKAESKA